MITLQHIREASGDKEAYQKFFNSLLKKFGVKSQSELEGDKKKKFYDALDSGWEGDNEKPEAGDKKESVELDERLKNAKLVFNRLFSDVTKSITTLTKSIDALAKADYDLDLHDQVISMEQHLNKVSDAASKASKIIKGM